jgi:hypothetical protein
MRKIAALIFLAVALSLAAGCAMTGQAPANYYENDLHHGYPGPAVADPSAV